MILAIGNWQSYLLFRSYLYSVARAADNGMKMMMVMVMVIMMLVMIILMVMIMMVLLMFKMMSSGHVSSKDCASVIFYLADKCTKVTIEFFP